ncbi:aminodeoxychorismate synthase component I [Tautonia plasticadhaerens]|uniref:aminodeoxychorismate synthase component I n=1 Tax=Tautonia plasticadhaerens TaxID=2527974 RepID=UPI001E38A0E3|nr:aminodeoxychorismate synthase component I [Tautonia plasticadhaerens]
MPEPDRPAFEPPIVIPIDLPADRLAMRVGEMPGAALLEGGPGFGDAGRWSILAARPAGMFDVPFLTMDRWRFAYRGMDEERQAIFPERWEFGRGDPLVGLDRLVDRLGLGRPVEEGPGGGDRPPFLGGLIGYLGYDLARWIERVPRKAPKEDAVPDLAFGLYDTFVAVDHRSGEAKLWVTNVLGESADRVDYRVRSWLEALRRPPRSLPRSGFEAPPTSNFSPEGYRGAVRRAVDYIHAGDIFQANISQRFTAIGRPEPLDLYRRLRHRSPSPYSAYLRFGEGRAVVSSSPELFYRTRGDHIITRPIKGTRPRGATPEEDRAMRAELVDSPKDRAELAMIVDLERNDLGRVCAFGSVRVTEPSVIESFETVHHQVATIEGRLRPGVGPIEVVRAVFPGGSITGAPKIRAMEIIDELEPSRRGVYTGAIGYFGAGGNAAFNIAIRTMVVEGPRVRYQVGGGIVADSDPQLEFEETMHKGRAMRDVLEGRA